MIAALLALIAAIAIPSYLSLQDKARQGVSISYANDIAYAINIRNLDQSQPAISSIDWSSTEEMVDALGVELSPKFSDHSAFIAAVGRVKFVGDIATVNTKFD